MTTRTLICLLAGSTLMVWQPEAGSAQTEQSLGFSLDSLLSTPVSTVSKYEQKQTDAPAFVTIVSARDIREYGYRTLEDVLANQVGFYLSNDREYADVGMRGFGRPGQYNNKVLILVDGHAINDNYTGGTRVGTALLIDLDDVERIEIVRGPGSSLYGARAMMAVVNMVTRTGRDRDGWEAKGTLGTLGTKGGLFGYGGAWGTDRDLAASVSWGESAGEDIYYAELDFPHMNNGRAEGADWVKYLRTRASFRDGGLTVHGAFGQRAKGIPTGAYHTTFNHPDAETRDLNLFVEGRYDRTLSPAAELTVRAYADRYENEGRYPFGGTEGPDRGTPVAEPYIDVRSLGGEVRMRWDPSPKHRMVLGLESLRVFRAFQEITSDRGLLFGGDFPYSILSAFLHEEFQVNPDLSLTLGLRRDQYSTKGSATTPRAAIVYHANPATTLKLMAGGAFRAPNLLEMHMTQSGLGQIGNPNLDPERIRTLEFVLEQRISEVAVTVSAFHNKGRDLVELVEIATPDSLRHDFGRIAFQQQNIANVRSAGLDTEARAALPWDVMARLGYSFLDAHDEATGSDLLNAPRHTFRVSAGKGLPRDSHLGIDLRRESGRRTIYGSLTDPATVADIAFTAGDPSESLVIQVAVKNAFDARYLAPGGFQHVQTALPQQGRTLVVRAGWHW